MGTSRPIFVSEPRSTLEVLTSTHWAGRVPRATSRPQVAAWSLMAAVTSHHSELCWCGPERWLWEPLLLSLLARLCSCRCFLLCEIILPTVSWAWSAGNSLLWGQMQGNLRSYCLSPKGCPYLLIQFLLAASTYGSSYRVQVIQPTPFSACCERTRMIAWVPLLSIP